MKKANLHRGTALPKGTARAQVIRTPKGTAHQRGNTNAVKTGKVYALRGRRDAIRIDCAVENRSLGSGASMLDTCIYG